MLLVLVVVLAGVALYGMWAFWPSEVGNSTKLVKEKTVHFFGWEGTLSTEKLFFAAVAFAGALGGMAHSIRSFAVYVGNRELKWTWVPFYLLKPVLGALLGTLLYILLRAGLFSGSASTQEASPYGFAGIAALTGLFTDQAVEKLRKIAEQVFEPLGPQADHYEAETPIAVTGEAAAATTEASLKGSVNPRGRETTWFFELGPDVNYGAQTATETIAAAMKDVPVEAALAGLAPGTTYHYRLVARNAAGTTRGEDRTFTTGA